MGAKDNDDEEDNEGEYDVVHEEVKNDHDKDAEEKDGKPGEERRTADERQEEWDQRQKE